MKIAVLASGGVDSSVVLNLLKKEGHDLTAFYLKIWLEDEMSYMGQCPWKEDLAYVRTICQKLGVPLEVVNMQEEYWDRVVSYTIAEAKAGRTPNPDIFCNQLVKFGAFYDKIDDSFEKVATGHYAQVIKDTGHRTQNTAEAFLLKRAPDPVKDQTYFLAHLSQDQLSRAMFPIGKYKKEEVRKLAQEFDLPNKDRKDSQGICFLGKVPFREFIKHHLNEMPGDFVDFETGEKVGEHLGYWFYTIGQRQGLGLGGGPWFVVNKDIEKNIVYLAQGYEPEEVYRDEFEVGEIHLINVQCPMTNVQLKVKIRHGAAMHECELDGNKVKLSEKVNGIAPGQYAVFYDGDVCLGCAMITS
ncbi:tRNA 2-thiouridine(34) synthase MnmA [Patescibacteria group bacterium]|nr:tRNA 2-thiouridine(34) synthase MnmA [Patescibacteria group bacterium]